MNRVKEKEGEGQSMFIFLLSQDLGGVSRHFQLQSKRVYYMAVFQKVEDPCNVLYSILMIARQGKSQSSHEYHPE